MTEKCSCHACQSEVRDEKLEDLFLEIDQVKKIIIAGNYQLAADILEDIERDLRRASNG